ncbi:MAG: Zn-dependent exopeptidase M28 [Planctomycetes bacterium]|nr:Zn-dependent exopeptidase M28 [Planctomycetota bacterium]
MASKGPALLLLVIAATAACFGATLATRRQTDASIPQTPTDDNALPVDRKAARKLTAVPAPDWLGERAFAHVKAVTAFGMRHPGTPGWSRQLDYIDTELRKAGLTPVRDTWTDRKERITFTNLHATIPGSSKERIALACHHDTKCTQGHQDPENNFHFVGANDGGSGVGLLLALAPVLQQRQNKASIDLIFFDGEESLDWRWGDGSRALFGSRRFVKRHRDKLLLGEEPPIRALVLLDMVGRTDLAIDEETKSTRSMREILWAAAVATGHQQHFFGTAQGASDDHVPFLEVGIPSVDLIDLASNPHWHKSTDTIENMSAASIQKVGEVVLTMLPAVEADHVVVPTAGGLESGR